MNARGPLRRRTGSAWDDVARAVAGFDKRHKEFAYLELNGDARPPPGFDSPLLLLARRLVRGTDELQKPNDQRLRGVPRFAAAGAEAEAVLEGADPSPSSSSSG